MTLSFLLIFLALVLAIISLFEPRYRLLTIAVILLCVAVLIGNAGTVHLGPVS